MIYDITERDGVMYLASDSGLILFDGDEFSLMNRSVSDILSDKVTKLIFDGNDNLWMHHPNEGISVFNPEGIVISSSCDENSSVSGLTAIPFPGGTAVSLEWDPVQDATLYQVKGRRAGTTPFASAVTANTFKNVANLISGQSYEWKVRAMCQDGLVTLFSPLETFTTNAAKAGNESIQNFRIYPNPAADYLYIEADGKMAVEKVNFYDISGRLIVSQQGKSSGFRINISELPSGRYFIELHSGSDTFSQSIVRL